MSADDKILKELDNASNPEEARQIILNHLVPECRQIGKNFFECVENHITASSLNNTKPEELERKVNDIFVPDCMKKFNLEECLAKFENKL
jgi:hypothetical protein